MKRETEIQESWYFFFIMREEHFLRREERCYLEPESVYKQDETGFIQPHAW